LERDRARGRKVTLTEATELVQGICDILGVALEVDLGESESG